MSFYEAMEAAHHSLTQLEHAFIGPKQGEGAYLCAANDSYESSRLILLGMIRKLRVKGDYVAMVPNRDALMVAGTDDVDGLEKMLALTKDALEKPHPMSGLAFRLAGDDWLPWLPDASHPLYLKFRTLQVETVGQDYAAQKGLLDKLHTEKQQGIFTAPYMVLENNDTGLLLTCSVWTENVLALLPRTDRIAFVPEAEAPLGADWDRVVKVMGDSMTPLDIYPQRFQVSDFPTNEQFAAMGATALRNESSHWRIRSH